MAENDTCCETTSSGNGNGGYDLAVVGAGSAGFSAAIQGAELGAQVALIGTGTIGGTCVNVGCVPSKTLIRAAESLHHARAASRFAGVTGEAHITDWAALIAQKDELVTNLRQAKYIDVLPSYNNIAYLEGAARLTPTGVAINGTAFPVKKTIVATGASAAVPDIAGIEDVPYLTSTTALELETLPSSLLVVGAGYIGVELAQMFARAGVAVTLVCRSRPLPHSEPEISEALAGILDGEGLAIRGGVEYVRIDQTGNGIALTVDVDGERQTINADKVLIATGRAPNTGGLGLDSLGVELAPNGGIHVDDRLRTTNPNIYAVGDVTGRDMFVYMAAYGGKLAVENALNGDSRRYDASAMPEVTFTDPQVATVGLTERVAREQGIDVKTSVLPLEHVPRALATRNTHGLIKLVADRKTDLLVGAHMLAAEAGDSIQTAAIAIKCGMTARDLGSTIFPYLTMVEGLKLAAQTFEKDVSKLSCCAG